MMTHARPLLVPWVLMPLLIAACAPVPQAPAGVRKPAVPRGAVAVAPGSGADAAVRVVSPRGLAVSTLVGKVKLISDMGGALISDMGGAVISNNAGSLVANNGGSLVGKSKYGLRQARAAEVLLADARLTLHDATGRQLVLEDGRPITATSDGSGSYELRAALPDENLLLKVALFNGGELVAMVPKRAAQTRTVAVDTASTLGAAYVMDRFVKGRQQTFDRLPAAEAETLRDRLTAAQRLIREPPSYKPSDSVALAEALRLRDPRVAETFDAIKAILLGGLGEGRAATQVALNRPQALALLPEGEMLIAEGDLGRIRRVRRDGTQTLWLDGREGEIRDNLTGLQSLARVPDGSVLAVAANRRRVYRLRPGAPPEVVFGSGKFAPAAGKRPATEYAFAPWSLDMAPDGTVWVAQLVPARLARFRLGGEAEEVALPPDLPAGTYVQAVSVGGPGGALHVLTHRRGGGRVYRLEPDGTWKLLASNLEVDDGGLLVDAAGGFTVSEDLRGAIRVFQPDGTAADLPGPSESDLALRAPASLIRGEDGTLYVSDQATNLVLARSAAGAWSVVAGNRETLQAGSDRLTFNVPTALAFDARGRLVVSEAGGHAIKRWDGQVLETLAGGVRGFAGDGGPASAARFDTPGAIAFRAEELLVADVFNHRIRGVRADGATRTLIGRDPQSLMALQPLPTGEDLDPGAVDLRRVTGVAIGPDGSVYWSSMSHNQVVRLTPEGRVRVVAGRALVADVPPDEPDGPALTTALTTPSGLAFKPGEPDNLYLTELANCRVRRIVGVTGASPRLETVAGLGRLPSLVRLANLPSGWETAEDGIRATEALVVGPMGLAFGPDGALYVCEGGATNVNQFVSGTEDVLGAVELPPMGARIRRIAPDGTITTLIGPGGRLLRDPGAEDAIGLPSAIAFDAAGRLALIDARSNSVRLLAPEAWR